MFAEVHPLSSTFSMPGDQTGSAFLEFPLQFASWMYVYNSVCQESAARVPFRHPQKVFLPGRFSFVPQGHVSFLHEAPALPTRSSFSRQLPSDT